MLQPAGPSQAPNASEAQGLWSRLSNNNENFISHPIILYFEVYSILDHSYSDNAEANSEVQVIAQDAGHSFCTSAKRMKSILRHVAEAFPPARQGTILNSHRVIGIDTNSSMVLNCALVTYIMMTADVGLPDAV